MLSQLFISVIFLLLNIRPIHGMPQLHQHQPISLPNSTPLNIRAASPFFSTTDDDKQRPRPPWCEYTYNVAHLRTSTPAIELHEYTVSMALPVMLPPQPDACNRDRLLAMFSKYCGSRKVTVEFTDSGEPVMVDGSCGLAVRTVYSIAAGEARSVVAEHGAVRHRIAKGEIPYEGPQCLLLALYCLNPGLDMPAECVCLDSDFIVSSLCLVVIHMLTERKKHVAKSSP